MHYLILLSVFALYVRIYVCVTFTVFVVVIYVFGAVDKTSSSFSAHGKIGNFIIIIFIVPCTIFITIK